MEITHTLEMVRFSYMKMLLYTQSILGEREPLNWAFVVRKRLSHYVFVRNLLFWSDDFIGQFVKKNSGESLVGVVSP